MKFHYDLTGAEPIIRDYPVYDATNLEQGELLMKGATDPDSAADESHSFITAYNATAASSAVNAIGILNEDTYATTPSGGYAAVVPDTAYSLAGGPKYGKVIINPFAVYLAEHSTGTSDDVAITSTSTTTVTIPSLADDADGFWIYFPLTATGVKGSLRALYTSAAGSAVMDSALSVAGTSSDTAVLICPGNGQLSFNLDATGTMVSSSNLQAVKEATNLKCVQAYISGRDTPMEPLRISRHVGLNNLHLQSVKFWADLICVDHIFGTN